MDNLSNQSINETLKLIDDLSSLFNHNHSNALIYTFSIVLMGIFVFSVLFNLISIWTILATRAFNPINLLIINLAFADITYSLGIPMFISHTFLKSWPFDKNGCRFFIFTEFVGIIVSIYTVTGLSVERYIDITSKNNRESTVSNKFKIFLVMLYSLSTWIFAIFVTLPFIMGLKLSINEKSRYICDIEWSESAIVLFLSIKFSFIFLLPYIIMIISSVKLLMFLAKWRRNSANVIHTARQSPKRERDQISMNSTTPRAASLAQIKRAKKKKSSAISQNTGSFIQNPSALSPNRHIEIPNEFGPHHKSSYQKLDSTYCSSSGFVSLLSLRESDSPTETKLTTSSDISSTELTSLSHVGLFNSSTRHTTSNTNSFTATVRKKAIRLVLVIIFLYFFQWTPLCIFQIYVVFSTELIPNIHLYNLIVSTLSYSNTIANPVLYMLLTYNFKLYCQRKFKNFLAYKQSIMRSND